MRPALCRLALAALLGGVASRPGTAQTSSIPLTGTVLTAITVTGTDLAFGSVLATQTKTVPPATGGRFTLTMQANSPMTLTYGLPSSLGPSVTIGSWTALSGYSSNIAAASPVTTIGTTGMQTASSPTGEMYVWIGAQLTTTGAAAGTYSAPITLTVSYD